MGLVGCAVYSQKNNDVVKIEFSSLSRGYSKQISITKDSLIESSNVNRSADIKTVKREISSKEWEKLTQSINDFSIAEIGDLKSPTMKRTFDGARHSTITLTTSKGEIATHSFDDEQPHEKLQKLMNEISKMSSKE
jgi:hypothetical protein